MANYPELKLWLTHYREIGRTKGSIVYALKSVTEINENEKPEETQDPQQQATLRLTHPDPTHPRNWAQWDPALRCGRRIRRLV